MTKHIDNGATLAIGAAAAIAAAGLWAKRGSAALDAGAEGSTEPGYGSMQKMTKEEAIRLADAASRGSLPPGIRVIYPGHRNYKRPMSGQVRSEDIADPESAWAKDVRQTMPMVMMNRGVDAKEALRLTSDGYWVRQDIWGEMLKPKGRKLKMTGTSGRWLDQEASRRTKANKGRKVVVYVTHMPKPGSRSDFQSMFTGNLKDAETGETLWSSGDDKFDDAHDATEWAKVFAEKRGFNVIGSIPFERY